MATHTKYTQVAHQNRIITTMAFPSWIMPATLALLMIDAIIELSFISSMVSWLHRRAGGEFLVAFPNPSDPGHTYYLHGEPVGLLVDQGHASNGAAGTAFVLIGMGGILMIWLRHRASKRDGMGNTLAGFYVAWLVMSVLSALLSLGALVFTFVLTNMHAGQEIDNALANTLNNRPYPDYIAYPEDGWTPENWFNAVLKLALVSAKDRKDIRSEMMIIRAWRWNLIPLFLLGLLFAVVAIVDALAARKPRRTVVEEKLQEQA